MEEIFGDEVVAQLLGSFALGAHGLRVRHCRSLQSLAAAQFEAAPTHAVFACG